MSSRAEPPAFGGGVEGPAVRRVLATADPSTACPPDRKEAAGEAGGRSAQDDSTKPADPLLTRTGKAMGTAGYMSPEQVRGEQLDARTDLFSFGLVLYEMATGQSTFSGETEAVVHAAIAKRAPVPVHELNTTLPPELEPIITRALEKNRELRYQSAAALRADLEPLRIPSGQSVPGNRRFQKRRAMWLGLTVFVVALVLTKSFPAIKRFLNNRGVELQQRNKAVPAEKRIAVLPLDVVGDETVRPLADGLVETMTSKLSQIQGFQGKLMVVPASEVRSRGIASAEAARRIYGANLAVTGSAQRWNDRIQFTVNLVDTADLHQIDSRTFELDTANPIALRDEVTNGAIQMLALQLSPEASGSIVEGETSTPAAYDAYLKGIGYLARHDSSDNTDRAIESLTEATRLDPRYALAFASLGRAHWLKGMAKNNAREKELALNSVLESIRLAPNLAEAHVSLGEIYAETGRIPEAAQEEWSALRAAPGNAEAYRILGQAYSTNGQYDQAEAAYREAVRRQPADWYGLLLLGLFYRDRGRYPEARNAFESALKLTPDNEVLYRNLAVLDMREGKFQQASDVISKTLNFKPNARTYVTLGTAYYFQRRYSEAAAAYNSGIELNPGLYVLWGNLGEVYRHLPGNESNAREAFLKAIKLAEKELEMMPSDYDTHANLANYWACLGRREKALAEIGRIQQQSRAAFADRIVLTYELIGDRRHAVETVRALPPNNPLLMYIKNDPNLESLWRDPALRQPR